MNVKKMLVGILTLTTMMTIFTGCNEESKNQGQTQQQQALNERPARSGEVVTTIKFGEHEAKVYEFTGAEVPKTTFDPRGTGFFATSDALYYCVSKKLQKQPYKGEKLEKAVQIDENVDPMILTTNGQFTLYLVAPYLNDEKLAWYDGKEVKRSTENVKYSPKHIKLIPGSNELYFQNNANIKKGTFNNGQITNVTDVIAKDDPSLKQEASLIPCYVDSKSFFFYQGKNSINVLYELDQQSGKVIRSFDGIEGAISSWIVTADYIIHHNSSGDKIRVYNRADGSLIGDAELGGMYLSYACTVQGNDVIAYMKKKNETGNKFYRIDF